MFDRWSTKVFLDSCFVSKSLDWLSLNANGEIQKPFPRSQHLPVIGNVGFIILPIDNPYMSVWISYSCKLVWCHYTKCQRKNLSN